MAIQRSRFYHIFSELDSNYTTRIMDNEEERKHQQARDDYCHRGLTPVSTPLMYDYEDELLLDATGQLATELVANVLEFDVKKQQDDIHLHTDHKARNMVDAFIKNILEDIMRDAFEFR